MRPVDIPGPTLPLKIWSQLFFERDGADERYRERVVLVHVEELQVCELACGKSFLPPVEPGCGPPVTPSTRLFFVSRSLFPGCHVGYVDYCERVKIPTKLSNGKFGRHDICQRFSIGLQWSRACVSSRLVSGPSLSSGRIATGFGHILRLLSNQPSRRNMGQTQPQIEF